MTGRPGPGGAPQQVPNPASSDPVLDRSPNAPGVVLAGRCACSTTMGWTG